jgi:cell division protein FtsB
MQAVKRQVTAMVAPTLFLALAGYFDWNATRGDYGLKSYIMREQQLVAAKAELKTAEAERDAWEIRVSGLRTNHIDPDTLDERARAMLNLADPNDLVVMYGPGQKLF